MKLSIIVVNWNAGEYLYKCIASIFQYAPPYEYEIWLVDNASSDGSTQEIQTLYPEINVIINKRNLGFAGANNQAIHQCSGDYVLLLNPDTVLKPQALECLVNFMDNHTEAGAAGSLLLNPDESLQTSCYPFPTIRREFWRLFHLDCIYPYGVYRMRDWDQNFIKEVDHIQGASLALRREALNHVGLLDEAFFMYSEELDLCYRLKEASWKLFWVPQSAVVHYGGQSTKQAAAEMFLELYRSKILFFRKNHHKKTGLYKCTLFAASLFRIMLAPFALLDKGDRRVRHLITAKYYTRLILELPRM